MELLIHVVSQILNDHHLDPGNIALRIDAENAFHRALRAAFLDLVCVHADSTAKITCTLHDTQLFLVVGSTFTRSNKRMQNGDPLGILLFALVNYSFIEEINAKCTLDYNVWCADEGTIVGDIDQDAEAYEIFVEDGPKLNFKLVQSKSKTKLWWPSMNRVALRSKYDCVLDAEDEDICFEVIILAGSPVGADAFVAQNLLRKSKKIENVILLAELFNDEQIAAPIHRACLSVFLFTYIFRTTLPDQTMSTTRLRTTSVDEEETR